MSDASLRTESAFPKLDEKQIARLAPFGRLRKAAAGEVIFDQGEVKRAFYVMISGRLEVASGSPQLDTPITVHEAGQFTGELDMLLGRRSLTRGRTLEPREMLEIGIEELRRIVQTDADLS